MAERGWWLSLPSGSSSDEESESHWPTAGHSTSLGASYHSTTAPSTSTSNFVLNSNYDSSDSWFSGVQAWTLRYVGDDQNPRRRYEQDVHAGKHTIGARPRAPAASSRKKLLTASTGQQQAAAHRPRSTPRASHRADVQPTRPVHRPSAQPPPASTARPSVGASRGQPAMPLALCHAGAPKPPPGPTIAVCPPGGVPRRRIRHQQRLGIPPRQPAPLVPPASPTQRRHKGLRRLIARALHQRSRALLAALFFLSIQSASGHPS